MTPEIMNAADWLAEQVRHYQYAEVTIKVVIHDGQVRQVERSITEKIRPTEK